MRDLYGTSKYIYICGKCEVFIHHSISFVSPGRHLKQDTKALLFLSNEQKQHCNTHEIASIMSTPISTQQCAWSARASGSPDTQ